MLGTGTWRDNPPLAAAGKGCSLDVVEWPDLAGYDVMLKVVPSSVGIAAVAPAALTIIPEPGGCLLLIAGSAAVLRRKRRSAG